MTKANLKVVEDKKMDSSEKTKALDVAMGQIEQTYGKGSIMKLGQRSVMDVEAISTGSSIFRCRFGYWRSSQRKNC